VVAREPWRDFDPLRDARGAAGTGYPLLHVSEWSDGFVAPPRHRAFVDTAGVWFADGRIDTLVVAAGSVSRSSASAGAPVRVCVSPGRVRRSWSTSELELAHHVFTPEQVRPLLLSWVSLVNRTGEPLLVNYSELWDAPAREVQAAEAACEGRSSEGILALADVSPVPRAHAPAVVPETGLSLDLRFAIPPRAVRALTFAYLATRSEESPATLARAWRGGVKAEYARTAQAWWDRLGDDPQAAYLRRADAQRGASSALGSTNSDEPS